MHCDFAISYIAIYQIFFIPPYAVNAAVDFKRAPNCLSIFGKLGRQYIALLRGSQTGIMELDNTGGAGIPN